MTSSKRQRSSFIPVIVLVTVVACTPSTNSAFQPTPSFISKQVAHQTKLYAGVGSGGNDRPPPPNDNGDGEKKNDWDHFLNPNHEESENLRKAREFMSENSLPISFNMEEAINDDMKGKNDETKAAAEGDASTSSALVRQYMQSAGDFSGGLTPEMLAKNPYMAVVSKLTPSELISKFTSTAHPKVQNAVRTTILGLIGGLPKMAFDTTTITTGQKLASLMFQLQMTGYMFKNAEYRLSLQQSLGITEMNTDQFLLSGSNNGEKFDPLKGKVRGKLRIKYGSKMPRMETEEEQSKEEESPSSDGIEMEVDAAAYMSELRSEVAKLRDELTHSQLKQQEELNKDLLMYIRTLPPRQLQSLTNTMSQDVLVAMKGLVNAIMSGIGDGQIGPNTVTEQSGEAMAQLCMWQLVIGYNLRTLEVREEMKKSLSGGFNESDDEGGVDLSQDGVLE